MVLAAIFFFQAEDGIRDKLVTGVQTCALPIFEADPEECEVRLDHEIPDVIGRELSQRLADLLERTGGIAPRLQRSEERREGKRVDLGGRRIIKKKKRKIW